MITINLIRTQWVRKWLFLLVTDEYVEFDK